MQNFEWEYNRFLLDQVNQEIAFLFRAEHDSGINEKKCTFCVPTKNNQFYCLRFKHLQEFKQGILEKIRDLSYEHLAKSTERRAIGCEVPEQQVQSFRNTIAFDPATAPVISSPF